MTSKLLKGSRPIPDKESLNFIQKSIDPSFLYDRNIQSDFLCAYHKWLQNSKLNKLHGLDKFNKLSYVHGTSQAFDFFYADYKDRRMRCFRGDFIYHQVTWRNNYKGWKYIEDDKIRKNDALIVSVPFSDFGGVHPQLDSVLDECDRLDVPVFIDCAYYVMARNIDFNLDRKCIKGVAFSMSKGFYGAERLRIGMRCKREFIDDPVDVFNSLGQISILGALVGYRICENFETDFIQNKYRDKQIEICKKLNLKPSDCATFGLADKNDDEYGKYQRGTEWRRVCISGLLGDLPIVSDGTPMEVKFKGIL